MLKILLMATLVVLATSIASGQSEQCTETSSARIAVIQLDSQIEEDSSDVIALIENACKDKEFMALLLIVSSGGGSSSGALFIADAIDFCKSHKPVVIYVSDMCASGAFLLSIAADYIVASPNALIGGIGVVSTFTEEMNRTFSLQNLKFHEASTEITAHHTSETSNIVVNKDCYEHISEYVQDQRPQVNRDNPEVWSDGKLFTGRRALSLKLIDEVGSFTNALEAITRLLRADDVCTSPHKMLFTQFMYEQP